MSVKEFTLSSFLSLLASMLFLWYSDVFYTRRRRGHVTVQTGKDSKKRQFELQFFSYS